MTNKEKQCTGKTRRLGAALLLLAAGFAGGGYLTASGLIGSAVAAGEQNASAGDTPFAQNAAQAGIKACRDVFTTLGSLMAADSSYRAATFWNQTSADKHGVGSIAGLGFDTQGLKGSGAGVVYSAPVNGSCEGVSVRIVPIPGSCSDFTASLARDASAREDLNGVSLLMLNSGAKVMALPVGGETCVAVTTIFANGKLE